MAMKGRAPSLGLAIGGGLVLALLLLCCFANNASAQLHDRGILFLFRADTLLARRDVPREDVHSVIRKAASAIHSTKRYLAPTLLNGGAMLGGQQLAGSGPYGAIMLESFDLDYNLPDVALTFDLLQKKKRHETQLNDGNGVVENLFGNVGLAPLKITKLPDTASPFLLQAATATDQDSASEPDQILEALLFLRLSISEKGPTIVMHMEHALVTEYQLISRDAEAGQPATLVEEVWLDFPKVQLGYLSSGVASCNNEHCPPNATVSLNCGFFSQYSFSATSAMFMTPECS